MPTSRGVLIVAISGFCLLSFVPPSWAEPEEIKSYNQLLNEVFQPETVYPQEEGEVQLLLGPTFSDGNDRNFFQVPRCIEYRVIQNGKICAKSKQNFWSQKTVRLIRTTFNEFLCLYGKSRLKIPWPNGKKLKQSL